MATQARHPAVPTPGTAGGILLQKANYRRQESVTPCSSHQYGQLSPIYALLILNLVTKPYKTTQSKNINLSLYFNNLPLKIEIVWYQINFSLLLYFVLIGIMIALQHR
ncbi:hypothetical protein HG848_004286 [Salmonella enterica]|nr:hypothetical protein [Salmonella enterica]EHB0826078.1 hypothetical protein [Salmonella enterica]EIG0047020.1 hypothetical protein [Salmonella enterica]